jgi:acyl-CoA hydrolase
MRLAYETAWACGWKATGCPPRFLSIDSVLFRSPVEVGALLRMDAQVAHAEGSPGSRVFCVTVDATMERPGQQLPGSHSGSLLTNQFSFVFYADDEGQLPARPVPRVWPRTYSDGIAHLAARRRQAAGACSSARLKSEAIGLRFPEEW